MVLFATTTMDTSSETRKVAAAVKLRTLYARDILGSDVVDDMVPPQQ
jgi:hypothetical protein